VEEVRTGLQWKSLSVIWWVMFFFMGKKMNLVVDTERLYWGGVREEGKVSVIY